MSLPELVQALNQPRSNVVRIVNTLVAYGLVSRMERRVKLAPGFHGWTQRNRHAGLRERYRPILKELASCTGELVLLGLHERGGIIHIDYIEADHAVRVAPSPVTRHNLRVNALGKLALSRRPDLAAGAAFAGMAAELEEVRRTGVAWNREESVKGMIALACPGLSNTPVEPMIAVAWPAYRFTETKGRNAIQDIRRVCKKYAARKTF